MSADCFLSMEGITKSFHGVYALKNVNLQINKGECRALLGENGAGKSTLMKILDGLYTMDSGKIFIEGKEVSIKNPLEARKYGINFMHQEICLAENMTVAENLYMGVEVLKNGFLNKREMIQKTQEHLDELGLNLNASTHIGKLSLAQQQMVEIARALFFDAKIVVMDEPTSSLTNKEVDSLFHQIRKLKERNISIIYISHRMEEIFAITDTVTVLRDGTYIDTCVTKDATREQLINLMVGRELDSTKEKVRLKGGQTIMKVENLTTEKIKNVSFELKQGEVLCFAGLVGAGRTETAQAICGIDPIISGTIELEGKRYHPKNMREAIENAVVLIPEDRKRYGLVINQTVSFNLTLAVLKKFIRGIKVDRKKESDIVGKYSKALSIKMSGPEQICAGLSGGNQQKVVISKWLTADPKIIIMDEPTRGIDVAAKADIYELIEKLAKEGHSIIMISSELPEVIRMASRVIVMCEGRVAGEIDTEKEELTQEKIMTYATGG